MRHQYDEEDRCVHCDIRRHRGGNKPCPDAPGTKEGERQ